MKLKITGFHMISLILVEVILIEAFLIFSFLKKNHTYHAVANAKPKTALSPKPRALEKKVVHDAFFLNLLKQISHPTFEVRDMKIPDITGMKGNFIATTYDLSYESCGKYPDNPAYGITYSGAKAVIGRTVAVDPEVISLGSRIHLTFPAPYTGMNGWYVAEDTGSKVKGNIIDVFLGKSAFQEMEKFGSRPVEAVILPPGEPGF